LDVWSAVADQAGGMQAMRLVDDTGRLNPAPRSPLFPFSSDEIGLDAGVTTSRTVRLITTGA